ncbi:hypothetical protein KIW84_042779 [Lathyrus oleraceus]|uniref:cellulase n=1 Tax=Pisum sativum TaxID=3888 RepID=A0A9D4XFF6_PEA|nr:hypothetical protein KIW84_042779 [Pisum sativum]
MQKRTSNPNIIYVQVGDAKKDHACWEIPEDMDTPRSVFKVDANAPGSEVAAETVAALAAASLVFRRSYQDELLWGAAWLHKATKNPMYLKYIQTNGQILGAAEFDNTFGWDNKHVGARILLSKEFLVQNVKSLHDYKGHSDNFVCSLIPGAGSSSVQYTPGQRKLPEKGTPVLRTAIITAPSLALRREGLTFSRSLLSVRFGFVVKEMNVSSRERDFKSKG